MLEFIKIAFTNFLRERSLAMLIIFKEAQIPLLIISFQLIITIIIKCLPNLLKH